TWTISSRIWIRRCRRYKAEEKTKRGGNDDENKGSRYHGFDRGLSGESDEGHVPGRRTGEEGRDADPWNENPGYSHGNYSAIYQGSGEIRGYHLRGGRNAGVYGQDDLQLLQG